MSTPVGRSKRITEGRLTPRRLPISRLLSPSLRGCFIFPTSLPAVMGRPCGFPSFLACFDSRFYAVPQNIPFELHKRGPHDFLGQLIGLPRVPRGLRVPASRGMYENDNKLVF